MLLRSKIQSGLLRAAAFMAFSAVLSVQAGETVVVKALDYGFSPAEVTIKPGDTVRWENHEKRQYHSVYFDSLGDERGDYFFPGEFRERQFDKPGDYPYICEPHYESHGMKGIVRVQE